jgi:hypothetical protein
MSCDGSLNSTRSADWSAGALIARILAVRLVQGRSHSYEPGGPSRRAESRPWTNRPATADCAVIGRWDTRLTRADSDARPIFGAIAPQRSDSPGSLPIPTDRDQPIFHNRVRREVDARSTEPLMLIYVIFATFLTS